MPGSGSLAEARTPDLMTFRNPASRSRSSYQMSQERGTYY
jgi:hypothetical protein